jgi:hypothetical protein
MRWHMRELGSGLLVAVTMVLTAPTLASVVMQVSLEQMTTESDVVVYARVGEQRVTWDEDHARILTLTTIEVIDAIKGAHKGDLLTIYQVGGTLDGITYRIAGALQFAPGEELVFFAQRFKDKIVSYGMGLGKYAVVKRDGRPWVEPNFGDVTFVKRGANGELLPDSPPDSSAQLLSTFMQRVRAINTRGRGGAR